MTKQEFLEQFEDALVGELSNAAIYDHKQYYERYIGNELRKGRPEREVLDELGNPRLIAKTLIDMQDPKSKSFYTEYETYGESRQQDRKRDRPAGPIPQKKDVSLFSRLMTGVAGIICLILIISLVLGALSVVGPVILLVVLFMFIRKLFGK